jgi:predicted lactoylglutathione lyase
MKHNRILLLIFLILTAGCSDKTKNDNMAPQENKKQNHPGGIVFFSTQHLNEVSDFYITKIKCDLWLDQGACQILKHGNQLLGFCKSEEKIDTNGIITFFYPEKEQVDSMYKKFKNIAVSEPRMNEKFNIYQFFAKDPEGRTLEFQYFNHELKEY